MYNKINVTTTIKKLDNKLDKKYKLCQKIFDLIMLLPKLILFLIKKKPL